MSFHVETDPVVAPKVSHLAPPWPKGVSGNPSGGAKGKRIATWMAEYGEVDSTQWPIEGTEQYAKLPGNAVIALIRLREAFKKNSLGLSNAQYVEPRAANHSMVLPIPVTKEQYKELVSEFWAKKT